MKLKTYPIRFTEKEHRDFHALAKRKHKPLAILIRELLYGVIETEKKEDAA